MNAAGKNCGEILLVYHDNPKKKMAVAPDFKTFIFMCKSEKIGHIRTIGGISIIEYLLML